MTIACLGVAANVPRASLAFDEERLNGRQGQRVFADAAGANCCLKELWLTCFQSFCDIFKGQ